MTDAVVLIYKIAISHMLTDSWALMPGVPVDIIV